MIRLAKFEDIPRLQELLEQILIVHHQARPDVFKSKGSKFTDAELEAVINDLKNLCLCNEDDEGRILGHLFLMIKEETENDGPQKAVKTLLLMIYVLIRKLEVKKNRRKALPICLGLC